MDLKVEIRNMMENEFNIHKKKISDDSNLFHEEIIDSLGTIRLFLRLEEKFDIIIDQTEIDMKDFSSINAIDEYVKKHLNGGI